MPMLIYALVFSVALSIALFFMVRKSAQLSPDLKPKLPKKSRQDEFIKVPLFFTRPLFPVNRVILSRLIKKQPLIDKLTAAEIHLLPEDYLGIKEILIAGLFFITFLILKKIEPLWAVIILGVGFLLPDFYLKMRIKKRNRIIIKVMPDIIDLLTLCVGGGLDFMQGLDWVLQRSKPSPFIKELSIVTQEIKVGKSRQEALKAMSRRLNIPEVFSLVNTLVAADRMGTPVYDVLNALGEETRRQRFQRGERLALQAPIKMLFPLIVFIMPVVAIIVGGPILIQFMQGGFGLKGGGF
jgi:tight adherence protein C